jgi:spore maturation protein CgeB
MRILYVGPMDSNGTCYSRFNALKTLVNDIEVFDTDKYWKGWQGTSSIRRSIEFRIFIGPLFRSINSELYRLVKKTKPNVVWIDKGSWLWPSTLKKIRDEGVFLVHHITDALHPDPWKMKWMNLLLRKTVLSYQAFFTTNEADYNVLSKRSPQQFHLTDLGYDHERFTPAPLDDVLLSEWKNELVFIGHYEPRTENFVKELILNKLPVKVYGQGWEKIKNNRFFNGYVEFKPLLGLEYVHALKAADIALGFLSEWNHNQTTPRSFEIPACGTFLLAMRTPRHQEFFKEGEEAEFFTDGQELCAKVRYYLEHQEERERIALNGMVRCQQSGYSWQRIMERDWDTVLKVMEH